jgi:hypothetical protein
VEPEETVAARERPINTLPRQRIHERKNKGNVRGCVFHAVRAEAIYGEPTGAFSETKQTTRKLVLALALASGSQWWLDAAGQDRTGQGPLNTEAVGICYQATTGKNKLRRLSLCYSE